MLPLKRLMVLAVISLFVGLCFNAYACLLPVSVPTAPAMGNGCETPAEQPVFQVCDVFKTLGVHSAENLLLNSGYQALCLEDTASLASRLILISHSSRLSQHPPGSSPQEHLRNISVLRI